MTDYKLLLDTECPKCHARIQLVLGTGEDEPATTVDNRKQLTDALKKYALQLDVKREGGQITIHTRGYLDRVIWAEIHGLVKAAGGSWVTEGASSHWVLRDG